MISLEHFLCSTRHTYERPSLMSVFLPSGDLKYPLTRKHSPRRLGYPIKCKLDISMLDEGIDSFVVPDHGVRRSLSYFDCTLPTNIVITNH